MKKILIAEDEQMAADIYKDQLTKAGYEVRLVTHGGLLLEELQTYTPDLIVLDILMPIKDGFETLEELKKHPEWSQIPTLILSNLGQDWEVRKGIELGADDYVIKSNTSLVTIKKKIEKLLGE